MGDLTFNIEESVKKSKSRQKYVQARKDGSLEESHPERANDKEDQCFHTFF